MSTVALVFAYSSYEIVFYIAYIAWLLGEIVGATILPRLRYGAREGQRVVFINVGTLIVAIFIDFILSIRGIALIPAPAYFLGIAFMIIGLVLRQWAMWSLGGFSH